MSFSKLRYLSVPACDSLKAKVAENLERYRSGDFEDLIQANGCSIEFDLEVDLSPLKRLAPLDRRAQEADFSNAMLVWEALGHLTPSLATEARLWTHLTHLQGLEYCRARWLHLSSSNENLVKEVNTHFFAETQTRYRDDNALGRLWWAAYVAKLAMPENHQVALKAILRNTDTRSNIVERPGISTRPKLAAGIVRTIVTGSNKAASEDEFREFMKAVNRLGGGVVFEALSDDDVDRFMNECIGLAFVASGNTLKQSGFSSQLES